MAIRELLQEQEYIQKGPYHREGLKYPPFHPLTLRYRLALSLLPNNLKDLRCLDFGGGDGALSTLMADKGAQAMIVDRSPRALGYAHKADDRLDVFASNTKIPFKVEVFDIATMLETLEHIPDNQEMVALDEVNRVLKTGGKFIISVPSTKRDLAKKHYRHYSTDDVCCRLQEAGFTVEKRVGFRYPLISGVPNPSPVIYVVGGIIFALDWMIRENGYPNGLVGCNPQEATDLMILATKSR